MPTYAILHNPGHNRVYFNASRVLARHELSMMSRRLSVPVLNMRETELGGVCYWLFDTETYLTADDWVLLSRLSFTYALYETLARPDGMALIPRTKDSSYYFSDDISMMLKYTGKTNELFTRLLLNFALLSGSFELCDGLSVLDPVCGKGTTLYESLLCGCHAYGVDIDAKLIHEAQIFFKKYLETARYKHNLHTEKIGCVDSSGQKSSATRYRFELAKNKEDQKADRLLRVEMVAGDTQCAAQLFKRNSFHALVGDLPYGVQHSANKKPHSGFTRNAMRMLTDALPGWHKVLMPGGTIVLAWNTHLIPRAELVELLTAHGFLLPEDDFFTQLAHRVDQAIERDVIVGYKAHKPS